MPAMRDDPARQLRELHDTMTMDAQEQQLLAFADQNQHLRTENAGWRLAVILLRRDLERLVTGLEEDQLAGLLSDRAKEAAATARHTLRNVAREVR